MQWQQHVHRTTTEASRACALCVCRAARNTGWCALWHTTMKDVGFFREVLGLNRCVGRLRPCDPATRAARSTQRAACMAVQRPGVVAAPCSLSCAAGAQPARERVCACARAGPSLRSRRRARPPWQHRSPKSRCGGGECAVGAALAQRQPTRSVGAAAGCCSSSNTALCNDACACLLPCCHVRRGSIKGRQPAPSRAGNQARSPPRRQSRRRRAFRVMWPVGAGGCGPPLLQVVRHEAARIAATDA
jgi:hypothetical protein